MSSLFLIDAFSPKSPDAATGVNAPDRDRQTDRQPSNLPVRWSLVGHGQLLATEVASKSGAATASSPIVTPAVISSFHCSKPSIPSTIEGHPHSTLCCLSVCHLNAVRDPCNGSRLRHPSGQLRSFTWHVRLVDRQTEGQTGHSPDG